VPFLLELHELDHLVDGPAPRVVAAVHLDELGDRQIALDAALLEHDPHPLAQLPRARRGIDPEDRRLAVGAQSVPLEDLDRRRLTGAVRAEQAEHLSTRDLEADTANHLDPAV